MLTSPVVLLFKPPGEVEGSCVSASAPTLKSVP
ncbi:hypothetical protein A2U01_0116387, partial [Trifolium medium]|nr:hypothetical protein [Trifolium medium]